MAKTPTSPSAAIRHTSQGSGKTDTTYGNWFRGEHTHFNPSEERMVSDKAVGRHVLRGWEPPEKFIFDGSLSGSASGSRPTFSMELRR